MSKLLTAPLYFLLSYKKCERADDKLMGMKKKIATSFTHALLTLSLASTPLALLAQASDEDFLNSYEEKDWRIDHEFTSAFEYESHSESSDDSISVYNTGLTLGASHKNGLSGNFRASLDEKIDDIDSRDFELGKFVKEMSVNYKIDTEDAVLLLSVGKMPTGVKTDQDDPKKLGGVMGMRLSIRPEKIPLIQDWLSKNNFKINRIDIVRYKAGSESELNTRSLGEANMTSYALYLSHGRNLQAFFIHKTPDRDNTRGVTSNSLGAVYMMGGKYAPQFFVMKHTSKASFMDLDLLVVSSSIAVAKDTRGVFSYSRANESMSHTKKDVYDISLSKTLKKSKDLSISGSIGMNITNGSTNERTIYMRLETRF